MCAGGGEVFQQTSMFLNEMFSAAIQNVSKTSEKGNGGGTVLVPVVQISAAAATPTYEEIVLSDSRESPFSTQRRGVLKRRLNTILSCKGCSFWGAALHIG